MVKGWYEGSYYTSYNMKEGDEIFVLSAKKSSDYFYMRTKKGASLPNGAWKIDGTQNKFFGIMIVPGEGNL